jgi:hypothetical protein
MLLLASGSSSRGVVVMLALALALPWEDLKGAKRHLWEDARRTEGRRQVWVGFE